MPIGTVALVISALVFAPLTSYLAGRRARSAIIWFALGVVLGPLAVALLLLAPPGRCPDCGERVRGWPRVCAACQAPLTGAISWSASTAPPEESPPPRPVVVRTVGAASMEASPGSVPRPVLVPTPPPADQPVVILPPTRRARDPSWTAEPEAASPTALGDPATATRRYRQQQDHVDPGARLLGSGIFLGGSAPTATKVARLEVGDRYGLARDGDELHILGPVTIDPERVIARVPIVGADVELVGDRLVVQGGESARGTVLAFAGLAVSRGTDVVAILRAPSEEATG